MRDLFWKKINKSSRQPYTLEILEFERTLAVLLPIIYRQFGVHATLDLQFHIALTCWRIHDVKCRMKWPRHLYLPETNYVPINIQNGRVPWDNLSNLGTLANFNARKWVVKDLAQLTKLCKVKMIDLKSFKEWRQSSNSLVPFPIIFVPWF